MSATRHAAIRSFVDAIESMRENDPPPNNDFTPFIDAVCATANALVEQLHPREHRVLIRSVKKLHDAVKGSYDGTFDFRAVRDADPLIDQLEELFDATPPGPNAPTPPDASAPSSGHFGPPCPLRTPADVRRVYAALGNVLTVWEPHPVYSCDVAPVWDAFREAFCDPSSAGGVTPYSCDSTGRPDMVGLPRLIRDSSILPPAARDALQDFVALRGGSGCSAMFLQGDTTATYRERIERHSPDDRPIRDMRKAIRAARAELEPLVGPPAPSDPQRTAVGENQSEPVVTTSSPVAPRSKRERRDPDQPSKGRQEDIITAIVTAGVPLMRSEIVTAMKLKVEGKLGANLAWLVNEGILVNISQRGYWPADRPVPE